MTSHAKTDKLLKKIGKHRVVAAAGTYYDKAIQNKVIQIAEDLPAALEEFHKLLNFYPDVTIRIAKTKAKYNHGSYYPLSKTVVIDPRFPAARVLETLAHELVHAEQYYEGRLEMKVDDRRRRWVAYWQGQPLSNKGTTYKKYLELPHEAEAFSRQKELADTVSFNCLAKG